MNGTSSDIVGCFNNSTGKTYKRERECEKLWSTKCRDKGHHKDKFPTFMKYLAMRALNPLPGGGYCEICKKWGHHPNHCSLIQKYHITPRNVF